VTTLTGRDSPMPQRRGVRAWLLEGLADRPARQLGPHAKPGPAHHHHAWWKVMCLTGLDYFSTLGYQPGIAVLAAGLLSPIATVVLVVVTLAGALPVYRRVAQESFHGAGSIAMLERLLSFWSGKLFVLTLLGFAATDFLITITLSAADATAHAVENPHVPAALHGHEVALTLVLIALLGAVFLKGFTEAIGVAVVLVGVYLALNVVVVGVGLWHLATAAHAVTDWTLALTAQHGSPLLMVGLALVVFPKLALGLSGFETGVAVMPHIQGDPGDTEEEHPAGRIRGAKKLLTTAALIMSTFLITSSVVTTLLIPQAEFQPGGAANGRALAYLAHAYLGSGFGTLYDLSTIAILWFAGASAMAGMLNLMPRYLPRYGMAPHWARATRPMVLVFTAVAFLVTWIFDANVDSTLAARRAGQRGWTVGFAVISVVFLYTTGANVVERPDGVKIGACFIAGIVLISALSRLLRAFELRVTHLALDDTAASFVDGASEKIRLIANEPDSRDEEEYREKLRQIQCDHDVPADAEMLFVEVTIGDPSDFETALDVHGELMHGRYRVLTLQSATIANALAALLLHVRDRTGRRPHMYFEWTEGNPAAHLLRFLLFGQGEVAPVTREVLREAEPDRYRRPHVHVG
jgi:hypothetical protein